MSTPYYITRPGGKPSGPFTIDELEQKAAAGELTPGHLYCVEGMSEWLPIERIVDLPSRDEPEGVVQCPAAEVNAEEETPPVPKAQSEPSVPVPTGTKPDTHTAGGIILLVISFFMFPLSIPFAIVALVQASRAESAWNLCRPGECAGLAESAGFWVKFTVGTMVLQIILFFVFIAYIADRIIPHLENSLNNLSPEVYSIYL